MSLLLVLLGAAVGAGATWSFVRGTLEAQEKELEHRRKQIDGAESEASTLGRRVALRDRQLALAAAQRDDYAKLASTHAVDSARWTAGEWVRKVWKERRYGGHPQQNLEDLRRDFEPFAEEHVLLAVDIELLGGWKSLLDVEHSTASVTTPLSAGDTLLFEGPGARVVEQLSTFLHDDDTGFYEPAEDPEAEGLWRDENSPMVWRLTLDVLQAEVPNHVEFVEVLRVQKELEEVVIERPVVRAVPADVANSLSHHTKEEIVALIEAVLEVRELGMAQRLPAERAALPPSLQRQDSD